MKYLHLLLFFCCFGNLTNAQVKANPHFGLNTVVNDFTVGDLSFEGNVGFTAGVFGRIGVDSKLYGVAGLQYTGLNMLVFQTDSTAARVELGTASSKYIKIPLNLAYSITGSGGLLNIYAQGGITASFGFTEDEDILPNLGPLIRDNGVIIGGNVGVGVDVLFITAFLNYEGGFSKLYENSDQAANVVSLVVGFKF